MAKKRKKTLKKLTPVERRQIILERLKDPEEEAPTINDLLEHTDHLCSEKTIRRDIDDLNEMGADIHWERIDGKCRWLIKNDFRLPNTFTAEDMVHFLILKNALSKNEAGFLDSQIGVLSQKLAAVSIEQRDIHNQDIDAAVSFKPPPVRRVEPDTWEKLFHAVIHRKRVDVEYCSGGKTAKNCTLRPYHITCLEGEWYLLAGTDGKPAPRQYTLAAIGNVQTHSGKNMFTHPPGFDPIELLDSTFGRFIGARGPTITVRIRISSFMTQFVRDRPWHRQQEINELDDGQSLEISFPVRKSGPHPFGNLVSWVLGMGPHAEVLEPRELIDKVKEEAAGILALYRG